MTSNICSSSLPERSHSVKILEVEDERAININLLPYLIHVALYVMNTTRSVAREEKNLGNFLRTPLDKWVETSFEVDGPLYWITMATCVLDRDKWMENRLTLFKRLLVLTHARNVMPSGATSLSDKTPKEYSAYKPYLLFFGLANTLPNIIFKRCSLGNESTWAGAAAEYIRQNDQNMLENGKKILSTYEQEILPCESFGEFCDVVGLLEEIPNPDSFLKDLLASLP